MTSEDNSHKSNNNNINNASIQDFYMNLNKNDINFNQLYFEETQDDIDDVDRTILQKDRSSCTAQELEIIRRERNRIHAKKTRLRKKKILNQMEGVSFVCIDTLFQLIK